MRRPWGIWYENAEGVMVRATQATFRTQIGALMRMRALRRENPAVVFYVRKHVNFEATP
jgi:hypothetical protein